MKECNGIIFRVQTVSFCGTIAGKIRQGWQPTQGGDRGHTIIEQYLWLKIIETLFNQILRSCEILE